VKGVTMGEVRKEFITLPLSEIHPYKNNPRINDDAVADVVESIKMFSVSETVKR
jgi:ParB-like chromosome segregation protein Spo0J